MNEIKQSTNHEEDIARIRFWGTIAMALLLTLLASYFAVVLIRQLGPVVTYVGLAVFLLAPVISILSIILVIKHRQELGSRLGFYATLGMGIMSVALFQGRALSASLSVLVISILAIQWLFPRESRRYHYTVAAAGIILMWVLEWIDPFWRMQMQAARLGPVAAIIFGLIVVTMVVRQAWAALSLRWKMSSIVAVLFLGLMVVAYTGYSGLQSLRYQLSNIYDFMLVPIVAINHADSALADIQIKLENLDEVGASELAQNITDIKANNKVTSDVIKQYEMEWVTTVSPEFTQALTQAGKLDLQRQELVTLTEFQASFNAYLIDSAQYIRNIQAGQPNNDLAALANENLNYARSALQDLIDINNTYADFSNLQAQSAHTLAIRSGAIALGLALLVGLVISYLIVLSITSRLTELTQFAGKVQEGKLNQRLAVIWNDEVSILGNAFNEMTAKLQQSFTTLEQRVADRTRNLELAAEVGRSVSQVRDLNGMLRDACELILKEFDLYYVQVYLTDPSRTALKLEAGTGSVGAQLLARGHSLPFDSGSINGRAAVEQHTVVIANTAQTMTFRKNALLPQTQAEMAVPLIVANKVVGVLDMQSSKPGILTEEILPAFEALAGQLAVAIQNANLLAETEEARAEVEKQARRLVRTGWNEHLDAIHKPEQIGFVFDQNNISPFEKDKVQISESSNKIASSISIANEPLGSLVVEMGETSRNDQASELVSIVAHQVAQQIENLRLLESAERYRNEAEQAARLQTIEGWQKYMASRSSDSLGYLYDTKEVQPHSNGHDEEMFALPLKARDETVGKLGVKGLTKDDQESVELVSAVAERLSAHIENLRLFEETRMGQIELGKRANQLASVAEISTASSREFDVQKMLEAVVHLTQRKFGLYHCHVFLYNEETNILKIAACGWQEGDEHEGTHGTAAIPLDQEQSLVARAGRTQQAVIVNDVHNEPGWLPNPLLPDTAAELAVPLLVGGRLLGVLDVQADRMNAFTEEDANIQTTLASQVATALQNAYSFNQAQSALAQSERLFAASRVLTQAQDLQELVKAVVETMAIPRINRAVLATFNYGPTTDLEGLDIIANWWNNTGHNVTPVGTHYPLDVIRVMPMFISQSPVFFNDTFNDKRVDKVTLELVERQNLRAVAVLPLRLGSHQVGSLVLESEEPHNFTTEETRLFEALAPQITTMLENRRQYEETQRAQTQSEKLFEASRSLTQARDLQSLVKVSVEAFNVPEIDRAILGVLEYNAQGETVGMTIAANWSGDPSLPATPVGTHYPQAALRALSLFMGSQPLFFADMLNDERVDEKMRDIPKRLNYRCVAALPLFAGSRHDAVLLMEGKDPHNFLQEEIRLYTAMAPQIGTVLENRRQFEQAQKQADREAMLNVINQKIQSATSVEAVLQIAARELGHALGAPMTIAQLSMKDRSS